MRSTCSKTLFCDVFVFIFVLIKSVESCASNGICGGSGLCSPITSSTAVPCNPANCQSGYTCGHYGCARSRAKSSLTQKDGVILPVVDEYLSHVLVHSNNNSERSKLLKAKNIFGIMEQPTDDQKAAESSKVNDQDGIIDYDTIYKLSNPNYLFRQCCEDRHLPDACVAKCHFNTYTKDALQEMFFKTDGPLHCPLQAVSEMQFCAAQGLDHTSCCLQNGVSTTLAGNKCLIFCNQTAGRVTKLDYSYVACYDKFETIKQCFYAEIKQRMGMKLHSHKSVKQNTASRITPFSNSE